MSRNKDVPTGTKLGDLKRIGGFDLGIYYIESETHKWENLDKFERALEAMQDTYNQMKIKQARMEKYRRAELMQVDVFVNAGAKYEKKYLSDLTENQLLEYREMIDAVLMEEFSLEVDEEVRFHTGLPVADWEKLLDIESMTLDEMKAIVLDVGVGAGIDWKAICRLIKEAV